MAQPLPYKDFRWMSESEIANTDFLNHPAEAEKGYVLEVR